jgi:hypothetical protein
MSWKESLSNLFTRTAVPQGAKAPKYSTGAFLIVFLILFAGLAGIYVIGKFIYTQSDTIRPQLIVQFGGTLLGTSVGAILAFIFATWRFNIDRRVSQDKAVSDAAFELHAAFNTLDLLKVRAEADDVIEKNSEERLDVLYSALPKDSTRSLFVVIRFYERVWLGIKNRRLRNDLARDLFGEVFYWWFEVCFDPLLKGPSTALA